jgi:caa(3)-type oxidase subunit IV
MSTEHAHPTPKMYVRIAGILAVLTAVEVGLFYMEETVGSGLARTLLVALAFVKFVGVIGWYMHLRFESGLLSRFFSAGFFLAMGLYAIVLGSFALAALL